MPSVNSRSMPNVWPSSTLTTPSLPTRSMASAMTAPISSSPAEMVATRAICSLPSISVDCFSIEATTSSTASSMPRLSASGLAPAATFLRPSRTIAWASTVAVVVPSPATSLVAVATSRTSWAPWFSKTSSTSISRAIVTPSLVMVGTPNFLSSTTYRPFEPRVTLTASARMLTPRSSERRASSLNFSSLCAIQFPPWLGGRTGRITRADHLREHVGLAQDQNVVGAELDLGAAVLRKDDFVALGNVHGDDVPLIVAAAGANCEDTAALRLLLRGIGQDDPAHRLLLLFEDLDDQAISQRL